MRKFLALQWILLMVGISVLTFCKFDCVVSQEVLDKLKLHLHINVQKMQITSRCIILSDFNYKNFSCKCLKIGWKSLFREFQYCIEDGHLFWQGENFYAINGRIYGQFGKIRGFLNLKSDSVKNIEIYCLDCVKISEIIKSFQNSSSVKSLNLEHLTLTITNPSKQSIKVYGQGQGLKSEAINITSFRFLWPLNREENLKLWINKILYKKTCFTDVFIKAKIASKEVLHLENLCFLGNLNTDFIQCFSLFLKAKNFVIGNKNLIEFAGKSSVLTITGKGTLNPTNGDFNLFSCKGWLLPIFSEITKFYPIPYTIASDGHLFFSIYGTLKSLRAIMYARNLDINDEKFSSAQFYCHYQKEKRLCGHSQIFGNNKWFNCRFDHSFKFDKGFLLIDGCLCPDLTYPLKHFLPHWWQSFFENFKFYKNFPQTNFAVYWNKDSTKNIVYGNVFADDFSYKTSEIKSLVLVFGHRPGYCLLDIKRLTTEEGKGKCTIHWPYNCQKANEEFWKFKGSGNFSVNTWKNLINDFVETSYCNKIADLFQENSLVQSDFNGKLYQETNPQENLTLNIAIPKTILYHFPIQDLKFRYCWQPQEFTIDAIQGGLGNCAPFEGRFHSQQNQFNFELKADHLQTENLLQHPLFKNWSNAIPDKNRSTYTGKLDLNLKGGGDFENNLHLSGKGWARFENSQLSQIHLLGPLQHLFSKKFKWKPTIELDCLISEFTFTEKQITSQNTILSGPSTRANVSGKIQLDTGGLDAKVHFSFLDYQQLKLPIMKQLFQLFQPISKGFAASVQGTFENPQWILTFNPFRFVLPQKTVREKRKKLALQKTIKPVD